MDIAWLSGFPTDRGTEEFGKNFPVASVKGRLHCCTDISFHTTVTAVGAFRNGMVKPFGAVRKTRRIFKKQRQSQLEIMISRQMGWHTDYGQKLCCLA